MKLYKCPFCDYRSPVMDLVPHCLQKHNLQRIVEERTVNIWPGNRNKTCLVGECPVCGEHLTEYGKRWNWARIFVRHCQKNDPAGHRLAMVLSGRLEA